MFTLFAFLMFSNSHANAEVLDPVCLQLCIQKYPNSPQACYPQCTRY